MFQYSNDHDGQYPIGRSSTEAFQKLLDDGYVNDITIFYVPLSGKIKPTTGQKILRPENVSWDVTEGIDSSTADGVPLVFLTGFRVDYSPGGSATSLIKPYPRFGMENSHAGFCDFILGRDILYFQNAGIASASKGNSAKFTNAQINSEGGAVIPNFMPPIFKSTGQKLFQLTPTGPLP